MEKHKVAILLFTVLILLLISNTYGQDSQSRIAGENFLYGFTQLADLKGFFAEEGGLSYSYKFENKKDLLRLTGSVGIGGNISMYIDLNDYYSSKNPENHLTLEGANEWITVWFDLQIGLSVGFNPVPLGAGLVQVDFEEGKEDAERPANFNFLSSNIPFWQVNGFQINLDEGTNQLLNVETNPQTEVALDVLSIQTNVHRFEIKKDLLDTIIGIALKSKASGPTLTFDPDNSNSLLLGILSDFVEIDGWKLKPNQYFLDLINDENTRHITTSDDAIENASIDGSIVHARGGLDINDDGIPNNVFPQGPDPVFFKDALLWSDFELTFENTGTEEVNYFVKAVNYPDGWYVRKTPYTTVEDYAIYRVNNVPPMNIGETVSTTWEIAAGESAVDEGTVTFELHHDKTIGSEFVDKIEVTVKKHVGGELFDPQIDFLYPDENLAIQRGDDISIAWDIIDPNDNTYISIAYDKSLTDSPWNEDQSSWIEPIGMRGNGQGSTLWNTEDIEPGIYQIWGVAYDGKSNPVYKKLDYRITIEEKPLLVEFTSNIQSGNAPLEVSYQDLSESPNTIQSWEWDLTGNGIIDSYKQNPIMTYKSPGTYTVSLTVNDGSQSQTETKQNYISVNDPTSGNDVAVQTILLNKTEMLDGDSFTVNSRIKNVGENTAPDLPVSFRLINPEGIVVDQEEQRLLLNTGEEELLSQNLQVPIGALDGTYTVQVRNLWSLDGNPANNFKNTSLTVGEIPVYSQYKFGEIGYMYKGDSVTDGKYEIKVLDVNNSAVKVEVSPPGEEKNIWIGEYEFFDGNNLFLKNQSSDFEKVWLVYGKPSNEITVTPNEITVDAGSTGNYSVITDNSSTRLRSGHGPDMNTVADWMKRVNVSGGNFDIQINVPLNAERKTYEFWPIINSDYMQVLKLVVHEPKNIVAKSIETGDATEFIIGEDVKTNAVFKNEGGYVLTDVPIKFEITGPDNYQFTSYSEASFSKGETKEISFVWNSSGVSIGQYSITVQAIVPEDPYDNNSVISSIEIILPPSPDAPLLVSPENLAKDITTNPILTWNKSDGAERYQVQLSLNSDMSSPITTITNITDNIYEADLSGDTQYFWRVEAANIAEGSWSEVWSFTTKKSVPEVSLDKSEVPNQIEEDGAGFNIGVENTGGGILGWTATPSVDWIDADVEVLDETTGSGTIHVYVHPYKGCGSFDRTGGIEITSSNASNSPQSIEIYQVGWEYWSTAPDLRAISMSGPPIISTGEGATISLSYKNSGDLVAQSGWRGAVYLSQNNTELDGSEIEIVTFTEEDQLCYEDPAKEVEFEVSIPEDIPTGSYYYAFAVDVDNDVWEYEDEYPYDDVSNNLIFGESVTVQENRPITFIGTLDPITLRAGDSRNQESESFLYENVESLFNGGSGLLNITAESSSQSLVKVEISDDNLLISAVGSGIEEEVVTVTIKAADENQNTAEGSIEVTVLPAFGDLNADSRVNSFDASRVLQYVVELYSFNEIQQDIADINRDDRINSYDASLILQYAVELIDQIPLGSSSATIASANTESTNQNKTLSVSWGDIEEKGNRLNLPLMLENRGSVYSVDFSGKFDSNAGTLNEISFSELPDGWITSHRIDEDGKVMIAMAGTAPFEGEQIATLSFTREPFLQGISVEGSGFINSASYTLDDIEVQEVIDNFNLDNNFPNPFNPSTTLRYQLPAPSNVRIDMYNIAGQRVMLLFDKRQNAGNHSLSVDMSAYSSGVYFIRFVAKSEQDTYIKTSKMTLIK